MEKWNAGIMRFGNWGNARLCVSTHKKILLKKQHSNIPTFRFQVKYLSLKTYLFSIN
jgi:hypothetical protein